VVTSPIFIDQAEAIREGASPRSISSDGETNQHGPHESGWLRSVDLAEETQDSAIDLVLAGCWPDGFAGYPLTTYGWHRL
jgi:hypothetical protein